MKKFFLLSVMLVSCICIFCGCQNNNSDGTQENSFKRDKTLKGSLMDNDGHFGYMDMTTELTYDEIIKDVTPTYDNRDESKEMQANYSVIAVKGKDVFSDFPDNDVSVMYTFSYKTDKLHSVTLYIEPASSEEEASFIDKMDNYFEENFGDYKADASQMEHFDPEVYRLYKDKNGTSISVELKSTVSVTVILPQK